MHQMKTEVVVIRLTKKERAELDAKKTKPILSEWMKELAFAAPDHPENNDIEHKSS
ncbi:MbeCy [Providencia vermicola]|uniref:MbeCy n=1 Tax=Providencia stuartii TaxID=588 RepID=A0AAI9I3A0_PROST|nr:MULTISPECIES: MbeCy [Providencia]ELR5044562.1 MbeCy [Providencia rettgeri]ELR5037573.1 MbeCy [Providencia stuartii]ELR5141793.1 MbeCy [Providencia stuartii]ELR5291144.1 MbeCy [Providencia stuartii]ELZ5939269.1 MbeCy [Providencia stuartii]